MKWDTSIFFRPNEIRQYGKMPNGLTPKSELRCVSLIGTHSHSAHRKWEGLGTRLYI